MHSSGTSKYLNNHSYWTLFIWIYSNIHSCLTLKLDTYTQVHTHVSGVLVCSKHLAFECRVQIYFFLPPNVWHLCPCLFRSLMLLVVMPQSRRLNVPFVVLLRVNMPSILLLVLIITWSCCWWTLNGESHQCSCTHTFVNRHIGTIMHL
jgi:hypothetical protein